MRLQFAHAYTGPRTLPTWSGEHILQAVGSAGFSVGAEPRLRENYDIVVIGGGQAGLAMSAVLQRYGREHVVLERGQVGGRWRTERWESIALPVSELVC